MTASSLPGRSCDTLQQRYNNIVTIPLQHSYYVTTVAAGASLQHNYDVATAQLHVRCMCARGRVFVCVCVSVCAHL